MGVRAERSGVSSRRTGRVTLQPEASAFLIASSADGDLGRGKTIVTVA